MPTQRPSLSWYASGTVESASSGRLAARQRLQRTERAASWTNTSQDCAPAAWPDAGVARSLEASSRWFAVNPDSAVRAD